MARRNPETNGNELTPTMQTRTPPGTKGRHPTPPAPHAKAPHPRPPHGRCYAPGDPPLALPSITLHTPFHFDAPFAQRLRRRELNPKEAFTLHDASGTYFRASLKELTPSGGTALPYEQLAQSPESPVEITLACAILARQRMIFVMQKATELGVARVVPLLTEYAVPPQGLEHEKAHAWPGQVIRATRQCRRSSLPEVCPPTPLDDFLLSPLATTANLRLYLDDQRNPAASPPPTAPHHIVLLVGPEGGFSDNERARLSNHATPWLLGGRVLRAETAVIAGLTAAQLKWGDFAAPQASATP